MPGCLDETQAILEWIASELSPNTFINLMDQYHPAGKVHGDRYSEISRRLGPSEYLEAQRTAVELGLHRLDERKGHRP